MREPWICQITFINVGNGDAILLEAKDERFADGRFVMLLDAGSGEAAEYEEKTGRIRVVDFLKKQKTGHVDVVLNTHIHEDHTCGMLAVVKEWKPPVFLQPFPVELHEKMEKLRVDAGAEESTQKFTAALNCYQAVCQTVLAYGGSIKQLTTSEKNISPIDALKITVLGPTPFALKMQVDGMLELYQEKNEARRSDLDKNMNDASLLLLVECAGKRILLAGDTQATAYQDGMEKLAADIFKVGHHGQRNSLNDEILKAVSPEYAIISASSDRRYNSAHPEILQMLTAFGAKVYYTDIPNVPEFTDGLLPHEGVRFQISGQGQINVEYIKKE